MSISAETKKTNPLRISPHLSGWRDSNPRPPRPERGALPDCATPRISRAKVKNNLIKTLNRHKIIL